MGLSPETFPARILSTPAYGNLTRTVIYTRSFYPAAVVSVEHGKNSVGGGVIPVVAVGGDRLAQRVVRRRRE